MEDRSGDDQQHEGGRGERPGRLLRVADLLLLLLGVALLAGGVLAMMRGAALLARAGC